MENIDCWRLKWQAEFGDAHFPSVLCGRDGSPLSTGDELEKALEFTRVRISALKQELRQEEFVKHCLESSLNKLETSKQDDAFINEYVYSIVGKDKRRSPFCDPDLSTARCDTTSVTHDATKVLSLTRVHASSVKETVRNSFDRKVYERKPHSWSQSRGSNSVKTRAPVPIPPRAVTVIEDESDSDYGRVWVIPSNCKPKIAARHSTGTMSASQNVSITKPQPPPVPKKPKPQPAPRTCLSKSKSSDLTPCHLPDDSRQCSSLPHDIHVIVTKETVPEEMPAGESRRPPSSVINDVSEGANSEQSKQTTSIEYTNSRSAEEATHCDSLSLKLDSGELPGVQDLCAASFVSALNIDSSLTNETDTDEPDMKKLYRTKSNGKRLSTGDGAKFDQIEGTYRKLSDEIQTIPVMTDAYSVAEVELRPKKTVPRSEFSSSSGDSTDTVKEVNKIKKKSQDQAPSYENWTIDRCLTRHDDSNDSDEIEGIYDNMVFGDVSPASTLQKYSYKGSKDSGLCDVTDDLSTNGSSPSVSDSVSVNTEESAIDSAMDNVSKAVTTSDEDDDGDVVEDVHSDSSDSDDKNADNVSLASDIVFIPASKLPLSPVEEYVSKPDPPHDPNVLQVSPQIKRVSIESPVVSSGEEETSFDEADGHPMSARDKLLQMRQLIVKGVLESEKSYLAILELLMHYKRSFEASSRSSKPVIAEEDVATIFCNIQNLYDIHLEFVKELEPKVKHWSHDQNIGDIFKMMVFKFPEFGRYMENYQKAVSTIHKCSQEDPRFEKIAGEVTICSQAKEVTNLEDALFKPVQRAQRNALVLHDLIKYTPEDHPDFKALQKALQLSQYNLEQISSTIFKSGALPEEKRHLVKSSFLVELISGQRKVRYIFLFSDVLICTKKENSRKGSHYDVKWIIPLCRLSISTHFDYQDDQKHSHKENIEAMKKKIGTLKSELRDEVKKEESRESKHWSISGLAAARSVEKLKKKIQELEAQLILHLPKLPVKLTHQEGKVHTLLMTTDYEREEWLETMTSLCKKCGQQDPGLSAYDIQELINSCKELPQVNKLGSVLMQKDEEMLNGTLNVTIHKLNGLTRACDTYCCVEMDSYDHFFMKARTNICPSSLDPSWDEDFELELDGTQTLRVLVYEKVDQKSDRLLGRGALELSKQWLKTNFQEKTICMNDVSLVISVRHTPANRTMRRTPSQQKSAVFGVKISTCARREGKTIPTIVTACIQEVEKRGIDETGIYRVSGVTSEVQRLKKTFDKNVRAGANVITDCDIHAVTGVLKLYFRELPEPLFTEANYTNFVDSLRLADKEAQEKCMLSLLHNLPDANYYTIVTLMEHLVRVVKNVKENKMTVHNLATVFGPTLLAPAAKDTEPATLEMMSKNTEQVMRQSAIVNYFLTLAVQGHSLRRSAQC